jgi:hypothetical protein
MLSENMGVMHMRKAKPGGGTLASAIRLIVCGRMVLPVETLERNDGSRIRGNFLALGGAKMGGIIESAGLRWMINNL